MLSLVKSAGRNTPNLKGKYALVFRALGSLVRHWPSDTTIVSSSGLSFVHCDLNGHIFKELFLYGVHEHDVDWMFERLLQRGDVVVDAGASFGFHALTCALRVGPEGHVYGVEPQPDMFDLLRQNIDVNRLSNVTAVLTGLSDVAGKLELHRFAGLDTGHTSVATFDRDDYETIRCVAVTVDDLLETQGVQKVAMLKLDVEGSELPILKGATGLLGSPNAPMCVLEINRETSQACGYRPEDILAFLKDYGYSFYRPVRGRFIRNVTRLEPCESVRHGENMLCAVWPLHKARLSKVGVEAPAGS